jgi:hypothetical protein
VRGLLTEYTATIRSAVDTMSNSNRDALRRSAGYKELEVSLRRQVRQLHDMSQVLTFDERSPVESALQNAVAAREKLLQLLFPHPSI